MYTILLWISSGSSWKRKSVQFSGKKQSHSVDKCILVYFVRNHLHPVCYPASRGYIFAVWAGVRKVASADNRSIFYRACAKFVTQLASNWFVKSAWVSRESNCENYLRTTLLELLVFCGSTCLAWCVFICISRQKCWVAWLAFGGMRGDYRQNEML